MVVAHDPEDELLEFKVQFSDDRVPTTDWLAAEDVFAADCDCNDCGKARLPESNQGQGTCETSLGGQEMPTAVLPGGPGLLPVAGRPDGYQQSEPDELFELPTDDGVGAQHGLHESQGGIGVDSCASSSVMARRMLPGYRVKPSAGSRRGQRWGGR